MDTDYLNVLDGESLSFSQMNNQGMQGSSDTSFMDMLNLPISDIVDSQDFWEQQDEPNYGYTRVSSRSVDISVEPSPLHSKEDFTKMLTEWQQWQHTLEAAQETDSEDVDFSDMVQMDMRLSKTVPDGIPGDAFDLQTLPPSRFLEEKILGLDTWSDSLNAFNLENFLENNDEEEHKFGLIVAEEEHVEIKKADSSINETLEVINALESKAKIAQKTNSELVEKEAKPVVEEVVLISNAAADKTRPEVEEEARPEVEEEARPEGEEEAVDVETIVEEQIPVLEAGDLKSLLEQFEASEEFNTRNGSVLSEGNSAVALQNNSGVFASSPPKTNKKVTSVTTQANSSLHETIRDSLPKEVIDRIKAANRRKAIPLIPAMPSKKPGRGGTRMQDAGATLSRNKLLKLVSGTGKGESIQLDHDYCSSSASNGSEVAPPKTFYHSVASEYPAEKTPENDVAPKVTDASSNSKLDDDSKFYSRLPDYYVVLAPQKAFDGSKKLSSIKDEVWEKNSKKDSGLESGEVSDASEETGAAYASLSTADSVSTSSHLRFLDRKVSINSVVPLNGVDKKRSCIDRRNNKFDLKSVPSVIKSTDGSHTIVRDWSLSNPSHGSAAKVPMVSVLKKNRIAAGRQQSLLMTSNNNNICSSDNPQSPLTLDEAEKKPEGPKKKKLNLEEYRSRVKELDKSRSNINANITEPSDLPVSDDTTPVLVDTAVNTNEPVQVTAVAADSSSKSSSVVEADDEKPSRPVMHSVEVQTQTPPCEESDESASKQQDRRSRKWQRKCYSKRDSSSSSSHSTSSSSSHRQRRNRSQRRRRTSWRLDSRGRSGSSSSSRRPRSRSNSSHSSSYSSFSSHSRSGSGSHSRSPGYHSRRSPGRGRFPYRTEDRRSRGFSSNWRRSRSRSPGFRRNSDWLTEQEKQRQVEERRVIYVGRIEEGTSKAELRKRFEVFGPIIDISVHFREHGDNYGFVTFAYKVDAYEAVEHGNDDPRQPRYDLCFGGRRAFCKTRYADLDGLASSNDRGFSRNNGSVYKRSNSQCNDFDLLLREAQAKLRKRKV